MRLLALVLALLMGGCTGVMGRTPDGAWFWYSRSLLDTTTKSAEVVVERNGTRVVVKLEGYSSTVSAEAFEALGKGLGAGMVKGVTP